MTTDDVIRHWRKGAQDSLEVAQLCYGNQKCEVALFHCHLAVEKALKARYMEEEKTMPPYSHDLEYLASKLNIPSDDATKELLRQLSDFAVESRYSDPPWAAEHATPERTREWIERTTTLLTTLLHDI